MTLRKRKPKRLASNYAGLAIPKGRPRHLVKWDKDAHKREVIAANRVAVFLRDRNCRSCTVSGSPSDHCHEITFRSQMRGKRPEAIFNTVNCIRLCASCHQRIHDRLLFAHGNGDGTVFFTPTRIYDAYEALPVGTVVSWPLHDGVRSERRSN